MSGKTTTNGQAARHRSAPGFTTVGALLIALVAPCWAEAPPAKLPQSIIRYESVHHPVAGRHGMVASQRALASAAGADMLARGGNAVDAAAAVGFALAVVLPRAGNIGGGGFMMIHLAKEQRNIAIDYREKAPAAAHAQMFLDAEGNVDQQLERFSHRAVGVPGTVAGLVHALEHYGTLSLAEVLQPAIRLAEAGFPADDDMVSAMAQRLTNLRRYATTRQTFFNADGSLLTVGELFVQPELAATLKQLANEGKDAFYRGRIARQIVAEMQRHDGLISMQDLAAYEPVERTPIRGQFGGYEVLSMPPPSSGGVHLVQMLNVAEYFPLKQMGQNSAGALRVLTEAMKYAYADRSRFLGDPDFVTVPVEQLTSREYAKRIALDIGDEGIVASADLAPGALFPIESEDTTHYSIIDAAGNAVANTYTLNFSFGSGITVGGAGFLLNNEMADFTAKAGVADAFGLMGQTANAIAPGKRPLSSMTPTIVLRDARPFLVTGSPGGSRIISSVFQHVVNVLAYDLNVSEALNRPRIHHQWLPDQLSFERGLNPDTLGLLDHMGYELRESGTMGSIQAVMWKDGVFYGAADPRRPGAGVAVAPGAP